MIVPGIAGMALLSTTFTALAYNMTLLREQGVLKRMRGTPLPSSVYLQRTRAQRAHERRRADVDDHRGRQAALRAAVAARLGRADACSSSVGVVCFAALGVALSHVIPNFDSATAYVNAIFLPVIIISGVFYDVKNTPQFLRDVASALPLKNAIDGLVGRARQRTLAPTTTAPRSR